MWTSDRSATHHPVSGPRPHWRPFLAPVLALAFLLFADALAHAQGQTAEPALPTRARSAAAPSSIASDPDARMPLSPQATIDAYARANAAVVGIEVKAVEGSRSAQSLGEERSGSGVVIGSDGLVLTIGYLVVESEQIDLVTQDGKRFPARQVAYDLATGFGLVQSLLPLPVAPAPLGSQADLQPGALLMVATGMQDDDDADVAMTQLVGKRPFSGYWEYYIDTALFTSPPVGNHSGAPLFNARGELVGIGSLFVMDALGEGRRLPGNMFVPVDLLKPILAELRQTGSTRVSHRPWLGLSSTEQQGRIQVVRVNADSPAQAAGMKAGDVVLEVDGKGVGSLEEFYKRVWARADADTEVELTVLQGSDIRKVRVRTVDRMATMARPGI